MARVAARRGRLAAAAVAAGLLAVTACTRGEAREVVCDPAYPNNCFFPAPPDLDCDDIPNRRFRTRPPDPHDFDRTGDGLGCAEDDLETEQARRASAGAR